MSGLEDERKWKAMGEGLKIGPGLKLSARHRAFIAEYIKTWDATKAARSVGYSQPEMYGYQLVSGKSSPDVAEAIRRIQTRNEDKAVLTSEQMMAALSEFIQSDTTDIYKPGGWILVDDPKEIPEIIRQFINKVDTESVETVDESGNIVTRHKVKLDLPAKLSAFDMLFKAQGGYAAEKVDVNHGLDWDSLFARMGDIPNDKDVIDAKLKELEE